jgi:Zn-dependent protease
MPVVPLDGSKILFSLLPLHLSQKVRWFMEKYYLYIFLAFILIIFNTTFLSEFIYKIYSAIFNLF